MKTGVENLSLQCIVILMSNDMKRLNDLHLIPSRRFDVIMIAQIAPLGSIKTKCNSRTSSSN